MIILKLAAVSQFTYNLLGYHQLLSQLIPFYNIKGNVSHAEMSDIYIPRSTTTKLSFLFFLLSIAPVLYILSIVYIEEDYSYRIKMKCLN